MKKAELLNLIIIALLAMSAGFGSFVAFSSKNGNDVPEWSMDGEAVLNGTVESVNLSVLRRNGRDALILLPGSRAELSWDDNSGVMDVNLEEGKLVFASRAGDMAFSIHTDFARVDSMESVGMIDFNPSSDEFTVFSWMHPSLVTFESDGEPLNSLSLPTLHRMKIPKSKVTATLSRLRLTKLTKEFPIYEFDRKDVDETFISLLDEISTKYSESEVLFENDISSNSDLGPGDKGLPGKIRSLLISFQEKMTVTSFAKDRLKSRNANKALLYSESNALFGSEKAGIAWMNEWLSGPHDDLEIRNLRSSLFFALPGDELYMIKTAATDKLFSSEGLMDNLRRRYGEIESLLAVAANVQAKSAFDEYKSLFVSALNDGRLNDLKYSDEISREYVLVELLLRKNAIFYTVDSISLLDEIESKILSYAGTKQDLDEQKQAFVQSRLRFLDNLFGFVQSRKISVSDATKLANDLLFKAEDYLNSISADVAVSKYFATKLEDYHISVDFINSPEFRSYDNFNEGIAAFKLKKSDLNDLNSYIQSLRDGAPNDESILTLDDAVAEVVSDLSSEGIQFSGVESLGDSANRLFVVHNGHVRGNAFEANYDRNTKILYDVTLSDFRFSTGIQLRSFGDVIVNSVSSFKSEISNDISSVGNEIVSPDRGSLSLTETVALDFAKSRFAEAGLNIQDFEITLVDIDANLFSFQGKITSAKLPVSGNYDSKTNKVTELVWVFDGQSKTLPTLDLGKLENAINSTYQALSGVE